MKKFFIGIFVATISLIGITPASASNDQVIAVIDFGIYESYKGSVVHEVCIIDIGRCLNGKNFDEGPGSATIPNSYLPSRGWDHGSKMVSVAVQANPNVKIVFIRIAGATSTGLRASVTEKTVQRALLWVKDNAAKYGIDAVSASLGRQNYTVCAYDEMKNTIVDLQGLGIATVFATGNTYKSRVDLPACINEAVSVGAAEYIGVRPQIALYSNFGPELDFYVNGKWVVDGKTIIGTSNSAVAFAAHWSKVSTGDYATTYAAIQSATIDVKNSKTSGKLVTVK